MQTLKKVKSKHNTMLFIYNKKVIVYLKYSKTLFYLILKVLNKRKLN